MSTATTSSAKHTTGPSASVATPPGTSSPGPSTPVTKSRFKEVGLDRYMFNPNKGCTGSLTGYILNIVDMPPIQRGKDPQTGQPIFQKWVSFLVETTEPCQAIDREKNVVTVPKGQHVLVPSTFKLADTFAKASQNPDFCWEVQITPTKKVDIGHGQTMWLYKLGVDMETTRQRKSFGPVAGLALSAANIKQLTGGSDVTTEVPSEVTAADDTPF
jgi:hypothetical protein